MPLLNNGHHKEIASGNCLAVDKDGQVDEH